MTDLTPLKNKSFLNIKGERIILLLGGILIGALLMGFAFKMAMPIVKKVCQSILEPPSKGSNEARVVAVEAITLKPGIISRRINTIGKLRANESVTLRAEIQGRIKEIAFKEGTLVKKGDVLIRFEDDELQAELARAEADVEYRQVKFGRFEALQSKSLGRGTEYDEVRGGLNMAKAQLQQAKVKLEKTVLYAPFEGKIGLIDVSVGAIVDASKELVTLVDFDPMKIEFKIPEKFIHDIGVGQVAEVKVDSLPDRIIRAMVEAIDSRIDPLTHSVTVRATTPNEDGTLRTGLFGSVSIIVGVKNNALRIPESALGREGDIEYVWVVHNGKAGRKRVLTGTKENSQVEIVAGLHPDEIVVTSGQLKLAEGVAVNIINMDGTNVEIAEEEAENNSNEAESPTSGKANEPEGESGPEASDPSPAVVQGTSPPEEEAEQAADTLAVETPETEAPKDTPDAPLENDSSRKSFLGKIRDFVVHQFTGK